ncbi:hypothetical protein [Streptomyces sp. NPDC059874]|uniref:hypothetical protein n=1 Tax=Streptomyces sp. NPDC059874 TaxID=3346983 RepID=UPI0036660D43
MGAYRDARLRLPRENIDLPEDKGCLRWVLGVPLTLIHLLNAFLVYAALRWGSEGEWDHHGYQALGRIPPAPAGSVRSPPRPRPAAARAERRHMSMSDLSPLGPQRAAAPARTGAGAAAGVERAGDQAAATAGAGVEVGSSSGEAVVEA